MENSKLNNSKFNENGKAAQDVFNNSSNVMTDMFKNQIDLATSFFNNLLSSSLSSKKEWSQNGHIPNMFLNMDFTKRFSNPFANYSGSNFQSPFFTTNDSILKQVMEFNQKLFSAFASATRNQELDLAAISEEYKETINVRVVAAKEIQNIISKAFVEKLESSTEINKTAMEEINEQLNIVMKQNQKLWNDLFNANPNLRANEVNTNKEQRFSENNKNANSADGSSNHKPVKMTRK